VPHHTGMVCVLRQDAPNQTPGWTIAVLCPTWREPSSGETGFWSGGVWLHHGWHLGLGGDGETAIGCS
jgi:hypothetical protein